MTQAREMLTGKWGTVAIATLVYILVSAVIGLIAKVIPIVGYLIPFIIAAPLALGFASYFLLFARGGTPDIPVIFSGFSQFAKALCLYLLTSVIIAVGMILLIIPGIIAAIALSMSWFIMIDNPQMGVVDIATESYNMTKGNLWKLFCLFCRSIGWSLLCCLTLGIGFIFLAPYMEVSLIKFYEEIKGAPAASPSHVS